MPLTYLLVLVEMEDDKEKKGQRLGGVDIVFDAHERSKSPEGRKELTQRLREAFVGVDPKLSDEEFVARSQRWYLAHRDRLVLNHFFGSDKRETLFYAAKTPAEARS